MGILTTLSENRFYEASNMNPNRNNSMGSFDDLSLSLLDEYNGQSNEVEDNNYTLGVHDDDSFLNYMNIYGGDEDIDFATPCIDFKLDEEHQDDNVSCVLTDIPLEIQFPRTVSPIYKRSVSGTAVSLNHFDCCVSVDESVSSVIPKSYQDEEGYLEQDFFYTTFHDNCKATHEQLDQNDAEFDRKMDHAFQRLKKRMFLSQETRNSVKRQRLLQSNSQECEDLLNADAFRSVEFSKQKVLELMAAQSCGEIFGSI